MSEVLSNDQVEALVAAAKEGHAEVRSAAGTRRPRRVREIDFSRPTKFTQDQQRRIERAHETFARSVSTRLSAELRTPIELEVINVSQLTWAGAVSELPASSLFAVVLTEPLETRVLLSAELDAVVRMVERLLGAHAPGKPLERELTEIELALTRRIFTTVLDQLSLTWDELMGLKLSLVEFESQISNVQIAPTSEPTLALTLELRLDQTSSTVSLVVPYRSIEAVAGRVPSGQYGDVAAAQVDELTTEAMRTALSGVEVELRAEVASVQMTVANVLELKKGDVIRFGVPASSGVTICADAVPVHRAKPGRSGNRRAIEVLELLEAE